jgi:hypothetical protein
MNIKLPLALLAACLLAACKAEVPLDVVMDGGEVFFVLESEQEISSLRVAPAVQAAGAPALLWELRQDMTTPVARRKYPKAKFVRYGQAFGEFPVVTGPLELARDTEYTVAMEIGDTFAQETFLITGDGKVVMPRPAFKRQRGRVYSAVRGEGGKLEFIPR